MLQRHIRRAGVSLIETALHKTAFDVIQAPSLASLQAKKTRELNATASATIPKVVTSPTT